jgi:hypothetical protein
VTLFIPFRLLIWRRTPSIFFCISFPNYHIQFPSLLKSLCYCTKLYMSFRIGQDVILDWVLLADLIAEMHFNQLTFPQVKRSACKPRPNHMALSSIAYLQQTLFRNLCEIRFKFTGNTKKPDGRDTGIWWGRSSRPSGCLKPLVHLHVFQKYKNTTSRNWIPWSSQTPNRKRYILHIFWVRYFFIIKPTRCANFKNLFWHETLHVSGSSSVHHQEFIHCTLSNGICHTGL